MNAKIKLEKKQKIVLILTIVTFMILAWQIYKLVEGDVFSSSKTMLGSRPSAQQLDSIATYKPDAKNNTASTNASSINKVNPGNQNKEIQSNNKEQSQQQDHLPATDGVPEVVDQLPNTVIERRPALGSNQKQYLQMVNQYEIVKMQRRLLEEQVAIANARHSIADTEQKTRTISGGVSGSNFGDMGGSDVSYQLRYLGQRNSHWEATILKEGKYHSVKVGSELPDGAKILEIDQRGVLLQVGKQVEKLNFKGITLSVLPELEPHAQVINKSDDRSDDRLDDNADNKSDPAKLQQSTTPITSSKPIVQDSSQNLGKIPPLKEPEINDSISDNYVLQR